MNCSNQPSGNDQRVVWPTTKTIMQRTENESWLNKKDIVQRTLWREELVWKQQGKARQQPESLLSTEQGTHWKLPMTIKNSRERIYEYWRSYYSKNEERIRQRPVNKNEGKQTQTSCILGPAIKLRLSDTGNDSSSQYFANTDGQDLKLWFTISSRVLPTSHAVYQPINHTNWWSIA